MKPDSAALLNDLAYAIVDAGGNLDDALALAHRALHITPQEPNVADTLGWIYVKKNLNDSAVAIFQNLTRKYPDHSDFRFHFGIALLQKGDKAAAKTEFKAALFMNPPGRVERWRGSP